jgi:hypothetical protein
MSTLTTANQDGVIYKIDEETGEVLGLCIESGACPGYTKGDFIVDSPEKAEWLLGRLQSLDAEQTGLEARYKAILDGLREQIARVDARRAGLFYKYENQLVGFAKENLVPGKKFWQCPFGKVSFRAFGAKLRVTDQALALEWAKLNAPEAIKTTEEFQISKLPDDMRDGLEKCKPGDRTERGFDLLLAGEAHKIETGL